jgi:hypothetical protein
VYTKETNVAAGSIAPGQSRKLDLPRNSSRSRFSEAGGGELGAAAGSRRSLALDQYLDAGACVVTAAVDDPVPPHTIANRSARTAGTQTIRLVVLPSKEVNHD